jgi:hypothetical protein
MGKSIRGIKNKSKKVGRPATGKGMQIGMRWHEPVLSMIDAWAARQADKPPRSEAIRRLVERGLAADTAKAEPSAALPADPLAMVDAWAAANKLDRQQAILALINAGIAAPVEPARASKPAPRQRAPRKRAGGAPKSS